MEKGKKSGRGKVQKFKYSENESFPGGIDFYNF